MTLTVLRIVCTLVSGSNYIILLFLVEMIIYYTSYHIGCFFYALYSEGAYCRAITVDMYGNCFGVRYCEAICVTNARPKKFLRSIATKYFLFFVLNILLIR